MICVWVFDFSERVSICIHHTCLQLLTLYLLIRPIYSGLINSSENKSRAMLYGHWQVKTTMSKIAVDVKRSWHFVYYVKMFLWCMSTLYPWLPNNRWMTFHHDMDYKLMIHYCFLLLIKRYLCPSSRGQRSNQKKRRAMTRRFQLLLPSLALLWTWRLGWFWWSQLCWEIFQNIWSYE